MAPMSVIDHAAHTSYSEPGAHGRLLADLPTDPAALSAVARNVVAHYRGNADELPEATRDDINLRWLSRMLTADQERHGTPLAEPRQLSERLQGCCRDHTLLCVAALRSHGIPARSRVGYAGYFVPPWHHDHVVVEAWVDGRWRRFDPEVIEPFEQMPTPTDIPAGPVSGTGFVTAAQVWLGHRAGDLDADTYGVDPNVPGLHGERFVHDEVIHEVAHRFGDELLLWDSWGRMEEPGASVTDADAARMDEIAALLIAADGGDTGAEATLLRRYRDDDGLHPGSAILQASPRGDEPIEVELRR